MGGLVDTVDHKLDEPQTVRGHDGTVNRTLFHQFVRRKRLSSSYSGRTGSLVITILIHERVSPVTAASLSSDPTLVHVDRFQAHVSWIRGSIGPLIAIIWTRRSSVSVDIM